jgi:hypothetical protein
MQSSSPNPSKPLQDAVAELVREMLPFAKCVRGSFRRSFATAALIGVCAIASQTLFAQDQEDRLPEGVVPPPLNLITKEEKAELEAEEKMKDRTKLALNLIELRLAKSENSAEKQQFQESLDQLGRFQALIRHTFVYLKRNENNKGSFKNFKRFEMTLREFLPRLELLRRELPYKYGYHVEKMIIFVRDARSEALEPFFDDTVIPEGGSR